jgi:transposase
VHRSAQKGACWRHTPVFLRWRLAGNEQAGPKVAAILSVVETCRRLKVPVREYLAWVLPVLGDVQVQRVSQYTPAVRAASRS